MGFATVEPERARPADLACVNNVRVWTNPDMKRRAVELFDKDGKMLARVEDVWMMHIGSGLTTTVRQRAQHIVAANTSMNLTASSNGGTDAKSRTS